MINFKSLVLFRYLVNIYLSLIKEEKNQNEDFISLIKDFISLIKEEKICFI